MMMTTLTQAEVRAVRAFHKLFRIRTRGWNEMEAADAEYDGGEWSAVSWAQHWEDAEREAAKIVGARFGLHPSLLLRAEHIYINNELRMLATNGFDSHLADVHERVMRAAQP